MAKTQFSEVDAGEKGLDLLVGELNHRIRNLLMIVGAVIRQTKATDIEEYRAKLTARISDLYSLYEFNHPHGSELGLAELVERATRSHCKNGAQVVAAGPDLHLKPKLALVLDLIFHELATNANKYGALSSPLGRVRVEWKVRPVANGACKLAILWSEQGGPEVKPSQRRGFGAQLIRRALDGHGAVWLDFNVTGLACFVLVDLDRAVTGLDSSQAA
jgi:two-component sensor histidine kinase